MSTHFVPTPESMEALAARMAGVSPSRLLIYLHGELGAGKTTFVRGFLRRLGYTSAVKSPTYTLIEAYELGELTVYHFDLYRLNSPQELEAMGIRDYFEESAICLVEWPENGIPLLPPPDIEITITIESAGRKLTIHSPSEPGRDVVLAFGAMQQQQQQQ